LERSGDYQIRQDILNWGLQTLRISINVDLFATNENKKCQRFVSVKKEEEALGRDALGMEWKNFFPLIHPPIPLILRCLRKVEEEGVRGVMILPEWKGQSWNHLLSSLITKRVSLGLASTVLIQGPTMMKTGLQLPPGTIQMCLVEGKMRKDG
jgi:hypothetical protein